MDKLITIDKLTGLFSKNETQETRTRLPSIDPLEAHAEIEPPDVWEAAERFPACLLLTDPILADKNENYTVNEVVFNIKSNDQGWSTEDNFEGDYEGSWTWFEVAILRPLQSDTRISPRDKKSIASEPCVKQFVGKKQISEKLQFVTENGGPFWHLQRNRRGNCEPKDHEIRWNQFRTESEDERLGWDFDATTGSGSGIEFMKSLMRGDRIAIIARAKQSGSINYISEAKIKIDFDGFEPASSTLAADSNPDLTKLTRSHTSRSGASILSASAGKLKSLGWTSDKAGEPSAQTDAHSSASPLRTSSATNDPTPKSSINLDEITPPGTTSADASRAQGQDKLQPAIVEGNGPPVFTADASRKVPLPTLMFSAPNTGPMGDSIDTPGSPKSPTKSGRWNPLTGRKKKSASKLTADTPTTINDTSEATTDTSKPLIKGEEAAGPASSDKLDAPHESSLTFPLSPISAKWNPLAGRKKKSASNLKGNTPRATNDASEATMNNSKPILKGAERAGAADDDDSDTPEESDLMSPLSPTSGGSKAFFGDWSDKVKFKGIRSRSFKRAGDRAKVED